MSLASFTHEVEIHVELARLYEFLCNLDNYTALHPLIESIEELPRADALPNARRYRVTDRIALGPLRMKAVYTAALDPVSPHEVHGHAWQSPGIRLITVYTLREVAGAVLLKETVSVRAPWLLRRFVTHQAEASHRETLVKMKALLEAQGDG
ncbi:MAG: hypothetical protein ACI9QQ_002398 [Myxococcota bacterium]|jgi:hypothetical protein